MNEKKATWTKTNAEIKNFINDYKGIIFQACKVACLRINDWETFLRNSDWEIVLNNVAMKFAEGRIEFDSTFGTKYSTYIFEVAKNCAKDEIRRQHLERFQDMEDNDWERVASRHDDYGKAEVDDERLVVKEALTRLAKEMHDKTKVEMLVRFVINGEERQDLADEYQVDVDYISQVKTRYLPRLQKLVKEVLKEEEEGKLKLNNGNVNFLQPYMKNW